MSSAGDVRRMLKLAVKQGWTRESGGEHFLLRSPDGAVTVRVPKGTKSLGRRGVMESIRKDLRNAGVNL